MPDSVYRAKKGIRGRGNSMDILGQLAAWSLIAFGLLLFATQAAAREIGYWLGQRHNALRGTGDAEGVGLITTGMIGLLGFVLALMLSSVARDLTSAARGPWTRRMPSARRGCVPKRWVIRAARKSQHC